VIITDFVFIDDCHIPQSPPIIQECPDLDVALPGGGPGGPGGIGPPGPPGPAGLNGLPKKVTVVCEDQLDNEITDSNSCGLDDDDIPLFQVLQFRKNCSFRLYCKDGPTIDGKEFKTVVVDLGGGPSYSVFWQPSGGGCPQWTTCPQINHSVLIGVDDNVGWLRLSGTTAGGEFRMASGGTQQWRTPKSSPSGAGSHLYASDVSGSCVQLDWSGVGVNCTVYTYCPDEGSDCKQLSFTNGILTSASGCSSPQTPGSVSCDFNPCTPFDPCD
jgi:hypothetical protein